MILIFHSLKWTEQKKKLLKLMKITVVSDVYQLKTVHTIEFKTSEKKRDEYTFAEQKPPIYPFPEK
jgi:hypothetical protein